MTNLLDIFVSKRRNIAYHCWVERWLETELTSERFTEAMRNNIKKNKEGAKQK